MEGLEVLSADQWHFWIKTRSRTMNESLEIMDPKGSGIIPNPLIAALALSRGDVEEPREALTPRAISSR